VLPTPVSLLGSSSRYALLTRVTVGQEGGPWAGGERERRLMLLNLACWRKGIMMRRVLFFSLTRFTVGLYHGLYTGVLTVLNILDIPEINVPKVRILRYSRSRS